MPVTTNYANIAYIDSVREELRGMALWKIIELLLEQLSITPHAQYQAVLLEELANVCAFEYARAQADFRRYMMDGYCCRMVPYRVMDGFVNLTIVRDQ
ncbi:uncharacterized protein E0L32_002524 [Thyridium curvatum]|uniref:Uncharacterized protein n=1 Tax=Thyridium curvatum TaxID=1093900 RepID=A0A507BFI2_9PEZI|nr:uncharacterized protein E0L32_002524 [Thyridium curvatum]TPX18667.1 hypothetical protein E0L32_002524 [Thyridium curvatum]